MTSSVRHRERRVEDTLKVGDRVHIFLGGDVRESVVTEIGEYPSLWHPGGEPAWGARVEYDTEFVNPKFGEPGEPEEVPGKASTDPRRAEFWRWCEVFKLWQVVL